MHFQGPVAVDVNDKKMHRQQSLPAYHTYVHTLSRAIRHQYVHVQVAAHVYLRKTATKEPIDQKLLNYLPLW